MRLTGSSNSKRNFIVHVAVLAIPRPLSSFGFGFFLIGGEIGLTMMLSQHLAFVFDLADTQLDLLFEPIVGFAAVGVDQRADYGCC